MCIKNFHHSFLFISFSIISKSRGKCRLSLCYPTKKPAVSSFRWFFILYSFGLCSQNFASFTTTACKYATTIFSCHTMTETMFARTTDFTWLISTFHFEYLLLDSCIRLAGYCDQLLNILYYSI